MTAVVALQGAENLAVEPGQSVTCQLSLANTGTIVEQFSILFMGDVVEWASADPPVVSLFPGAQQTITLTFAPPRRFTTLSGSIPFAVKVIPSNEPDESVTEEGTITVGSFTDLGAELVPRIATGRLAGRQKLAVDSRGNTGIPVVVSALDASDALRFRISPDRLTAAPGAAHFARITIRPRKRMWRGIPQQKPYKVQVEGEGERPLVLDGGFTQKPVLPKWAYLLAAILAALVLLWFLLLKPAVHSYAVDANKAALAAQQQQTKALANQVAANQNNIAANQAAVARNQAALAALAGRKVRAAATTTTSTTTTTVAKRVAAAVTTTTKPPPVTGPADNRLEVDVAPGSTGTSATVPVGSGSTMYVTDLIIQNVSGSAGTARIQRLVPGQSPQDLLVENLGTLTDQEFTFSTPVVFSHAQQLQLRVDCSGNQTACNVGMYYTGPLTQPQSATTTTIP